MTRKLLFTVAACALPVPAQSNIRDAVVKHWNVTADFTLEVAQAMPAASYNFRPTPEEMSFGSLIAHIGAANASACAGASGMARLPLPAKLAAWNKDEEKVDVDRETAIQYLTDTFAFCKKAVESMTIEKLDSKPNPARPTIAFETLWAYFTHTAHHRGQAEVYLRLKGIKPPAYKF